MSMIIATATESKITVEGEEIAGLQSIDFKVERQQVDVTAIGSGTLMGVAEAGLFKVTGTLRIRSLNTALDDYLYADVPTAFSLVITLNKGGEQVRQIAFEDCYLDDKSFDMETGDVGITVYSFTAKNVRET